MVRCDSLHPLQHSHEDVLCFVCVPVPSLPHSGPFQGSLKELAYSERIENGALVD